MQSSKIITFIGLLLFPFLTNAQQYQLNGQISIHNSRVDNGSIKYVKDAEVSNELSSTRITDFKGRVELNFIDVEPNSSINLMVIKEGYDVVNKDVLKDIQISENPSIHIFLAKKGEIKKIEKGLFKFSLRNIAEQKKSIFHLLNLMAVSKDNIVEELENNFGQKISDEMEAKLLLNQSVKDLEKELPDLVHQMAVVNLDFASDRYNKSFEFFIKNQLDQAIETLDEKELDTSIEKILASIEKTKETPESQQNNNYIQRIQMENVIESFELKKTFLKFAFRFEEAKDLSKKIAKMKTIIRNNQQLDILKDQNESKDIVEVDQDVDILLENIIQLELIDTNWVELEIDRLVSKGEVEGIMIRHPKAKTILETLPNNSRAKILGVDFENILFVIKNRKPSPFPVYEQASPVLDFMGKTISTNPSASVGIRSETEWLEFLEVEQPEISVISTPVSQPGKEVKKASSSSQRFVFTDIIEPNYQSYKITKETSLRQNATASSKVLKRLKLGTEVKVIDQVGRYWSKVILNGKVGYVKVLLLEKTNLN